MSTTLLTRILVVLLVCCCRWALGGVLGHSGLVLHVDKHGHLSGHSTHYDYRFYPEEVLFDHNHLHIDDAEMHEAFQLIEDSDHHHTFYHHHEPEDEHYHHLIHHAYRR